MNGIPGWVGPTVAIALVIIALAMLAAAVSAMLLARRAAEEIHGLAKELAELRGEIRPVIESLDRLVTAGSDVSSLVRTEAAAVVDTSRRLRRSVMRGARRVRGRLEDLDAIYEVVHGEIEATALDVAATLRSVRTGASALSRIKRLLTRGRR